MKYASVFTGIPRHPQSRSDLELSYAGLDWDVRFRTATIVAIADTASAKTLSSLPPIKDATSLATVAAVLPNLINTMKVESDAATVGSGWTSKTLQASLIMTTLCSAAWSACNGSCHGLSWRAAKVSIDSKILAVSDVSVLGRYAARTAVWRTAGATAVKDITSFDPASIKPLFATAIAAITESRKVIISTF
jgi:hypothetical protein